ncbi:dTDP-4-dehydrorhamnose 3,5-epimerase family protein [Pelagibacterales bacterium SAG-MED13]|nr:dTDP-4-dehydrorhamnose 3,5-epimerase family protein [Pelagibacterales bacterium SAG-MED13]|tara:strand:+ start:1572 stop:2087 length:516 start_codon:yes stop_codon:yes gene_type:complete
MKTYKNWKFKKTKLNGVFEVTQTEFKDFRGKYIEIYNKEFFTKKKKKINFVQDDISISKKNVLRGIHGDNKTWKLIRCIFGKILLVVVNNNPKASQYLKSQTFIVSDDNRKSILIPPKFGNGHLVLSKMCIFHYKQTTYYNFKSQFTLKWNDKRLKIKWPIKKPILSKRDT